MAINIFPGATCELPKPNQPEPQVFYYNSTATIKDLEYVERFHFNYLPASGPTITFAEETRSGFEQVSNSTANSRGSGIRRSEKSRTGRKDSVLHAADGRSLVAYQEPEAGSNGRSFLSLFRNDPTFNSVAPNGVDVKKRGYNEVAKAARKHGVDVNLALRIARQESGGNCGVKSKAKAGGVMQVIPATAALHGYKEKHMYDCAKGADAGVRELKKLLRMYNGNVRKALIGYNCGPKCNSYKKLPRETRHYIRVIGGYKS